MDSRIFCVFGFSCYSVWVFKDEETLLEYEVNFLLCTSLEHTNY